MHYRDIFGEPLAEAVVIRDLIEQASKVIPATLRDFVRNKIKEWTHQVTSDRREQLGYGRYYNTSEDWRRDHYSKPLPQDFKPFDEHDFEQANWKSGWSTIDQIGNSIETLIPKEGSSPVYAAMGVVSKALTKIVQDYVRSKFGDPISLRAGQFEVPVSEIKVQVWWTHMGGSSYGGVYRDRASHANGPETRLEVVVNREYWRNSLVVAVVDELTEGHNIYDEFSESIINTFAHEYAHLEQDIKGQRSYLFSYMPQRIKGKTRRYSSGAETGGLPYYARPAEIDAMATGAAAQVAERIMRNHGQLSREDWNQMIRDATAERPPWDEYYSYVSGINELLPTSTTAKAAILNKIKHRFLRTYVRRLLSYGD